MVVLNGDEFTQPVTIIKRKRGRERGREGKREEGREGGRERGGKGRRGREKDKKISHNYCSKYDYIRTHMKLHYDVLSPYRLS